MGASFPIVPGHAHIAEKIDLGGEQRFQWACSCVRAGVARYSPWMRNVWTVLESFRQHWESVHPDDDSINWVDVNAKVPWLVGPNRAADRYWLAPSGKRPAVAEDYTLIVRLDTDGRSVSGTAEYWSTQTEEKKGMSRLSDIEARLRELEKEAARYARFPKTDEWPVGTVIVYDFVAYTKAAGEQEYNYAVLKAGDDKWYWTGTVAPRVRGDYDALVDALAADDVSNIRVAAPDAFKALFAEDEDLVSAAEIVASLKGSASEHKA